jgi:hypothetical protein
MGFTLPQYVSRCGCSNGSPYTSEVDASSIFAFVRFARPSMFIVPRKLVFVVLMGLYLQATTVRQGPAELSGLACLALHSWSDRRCSRLLMNASYA